MILSTFGETLAEILIIHGTIFRAMNIPKQGKPSLFRAYRGRQFKDLLEASSPWLLGLIISVSKSSNYVIGVADKSCDESISLL